MVRYQYVTVDGNKIFYREAGAKSASAILLLHGFPTSSHMFRNLIPALCDRHHVVAPDLPGFGFSDAPDRKVFQYTFDHLAKVIDNFTQTLGLDRYAIYIFDYGAPVGLRLALAHPERVTALISQNGNAYEEGLSHGWSPIQKYWKEPTAANRRALREFLTPDVTKWQYVQGVPDASSVAPEAYVLDSALLARAGNDEIQLDLFLDYASNVALYPKFQEYFRAQRPPFLAVWGKNDPFFLPAGAEAFKRDNPEAEVHLLDTGHFALESHGPEITTIIRDFLARQSEGQLKSKETFMAMSNTITGKETKISAAFPYRKQRRRILGREMAYVEVGQGDPIVLLHGNPTSSYLWRNVLPHLQPRGRCIAPDLIGMGDSDKLPDSGPGSYRFVEHRRYLDALLDSLGVHERVTLIVHDWGSALGFDWANRHREAVKGIAYMEAIVQPQGWDHWDTLNMRPALKALRSEPGEGMVLQDNFFIEKILPGAVLRTLSAEEMAEYRRPFAEPGEGRRPTLTWPRQIPIEGDPADVTKIAENYAAWLKTSDVPKLFIKAEPGLLLAGGANLEFARGLPAQTEVTVAGLHFLQEDSPHEIGAAIADWMGTLP